MKPKTVLFSLLLSILYALRVGAQDTWQTQGSPVAANLLSVSFADSVHGWIAADNGTLLSTDDGGLNWSEANRPENFIPSKIFFIDPNLGWLAGEYSNKADTGFVLRTSDGGQNWDTVFHYQYFKFNDLFFINDTMGWLAGAELSGSDTLSLIMHTVNGGDNWIIPQGPRIMDELYSIHFRDTDYGQACGKDGVFFTTNNGGRNEISGWAMNISIPSYGKDLYDIYNAADNYGCAVGEGGIVVFTKDKWANHLKYTTTSEDTLTAITGLQDGTGYWAVGNNGCMVGVHYSILGVSLLEDNRITTSNLNDIVAVNDHHIWAVGEKGTILFYGENPTGIQDKSTDQPYRVYPNPATDHLFIEAQVGSYVRLYNYLGVLLKEETISDNEIRMDTEDLPKGIYMLCISNKQRSSVIKITIK